MSNTIEAYRLRSLKFKWLQQAGDACDEFQEYKGERQCSNCYAADWQHALRRAAEELDALIEESVADADSETLRNA